MKFFTASVRKGIYVVLTALIPLLVTAGLLTESVGGQVLAVAAAVLAALGTILASLNITPDADAEEVPVIE